MEKITIGSYIQQIRMDKGWSQDYLCSGICERSTLSRIENGQRSPSVGILTRLLERLGVSTERVIIMLDKGDIVMENLQKQVRNDTIRFEKAREEDKPAIRAQILADLDRLEEQAGEDERFIRQFILGTRARKTRSKSFEAFSSINYPLLGMVRDGRIIRYIRPEARAVPQFYDTVNPKVALMKLIPGADCGAAAYLLERNDALIIESFGVGGLPTYKAGDYYDTVKAGLDAGKTVVMTTQVENEGSDLAVYHVGSSIKRNLPILEAYDMTTEAVCAKLMWILGQTTDRKWVEELFYTPVACDILAGK